jgi:hypothetical protein
VPWPPLDASAAPGKRSGHPSVRAGNESRLPLCLGAGRRSSQKCVCCKQCSWRCNSYQLAFSGQESYVAEEYGGRRCRFVIRFPQRSLNNSLPDCRKLKPKPLTSAFNVWLRATLQLSAPQIAQALGWKPQSVRQLHSDYARDGAAILWGEPHKIWSLDIFC